MSSPEGVPYFKVTKNSMPYLIYMLQVHVTDVTEVPYDNIEVTLNSYVGRAFIHILHGQIMV